MDNIKFTRNLVKGKIAETVFAQILRDTKQFTVLEFGYEKIIPELVNYRESQAKNSTLETLRTAPDFAVINQKTKEVHLIEVKYLKKLNNKYVYEYAKRMSESWNPSYLFVATLDGFYFDEINKIIKMKGKIEPLNHPQIPKSLQEKYLQILRDFESQN